MWKWISGALVLLLAAVGRIGDLDFIVSRIQQPGWMGDVLTVAIDQPIYITIAFIILGLGLIFWWSHKRSTIAVIVGNASITPRGPDTVRITELLEHVGLSCANEAPTPLMNAVDDFLTDLRQTLNDGQIRAWGKPRKHYPPIYDPHGKSTEEIPAEYWRDACISVLDVFKSWEKISTMPDDALASGASKKTTYTHLSFDLLQASARFARNAWRSNLENFEKHGTRQISQP